jgi:hypothetical protein
VVNCENEKGDCDIIAEVLREERTNGTVDYTGGEDRLFARTAFSLEVGTGDTAYCIETFFKVDGKGKEVDAVARSFGSGSARENCGVTVANEYGTVCETCHLTGFDHERTSGEIIGESLVILKHNQDTFL